MYAKQRISFFAGLYWCYACFSLSVAQISLEPQAGAEAWAMVAFHIEQNHFADAYQQLRTLNISPTQAQEYAYYETLCRLYLNHPNPIFRLQQFVAQYPYSLFSQQLLEAYINHYRRYNKPNELITCLQLAYKNATTKELSLQWQYDLVQIYLQNNQVGEAQVTLREMQNKGANNQLLNYYWGQSHWQEANYVQAIEHLKQISLSPKHLQEMPYLPYYLAYSHLLLKEYAEVQAILKPLLADTLMPENLAELHLFLAESYYAEQRFAESLTYFQQYANLKAEKIATPIQTKIGIIHFHLSHYLEAAQYLKDVCQSEPHPPAIALYYWAMACLQANEKFKALHLLEYLYQTYSQETEALIPELKPDLYWTIAKLQADLKLYAEAEASLRYFLSKYPHSEWVKEAQSLQTFVQAMNNNANTAIGSNNGQDLSFRQGILLFNEGRYKQAAKHFENLLILDNNNQAWQIKVQYYLAESYLLTEEWARAIPLYQNILEYHNLESIYTLKSHYSLGYIQLYLQKNTKALFQFQAFLEKAAQKRYESELDIMEKDAFVRLADCHYALKNEAEARRNEAEARKNGAEALMLYDKAIKDKSPFIEHCYFYKALVLHSLNQRQEAISTLEMLLSEFQYSPFQEYAQEAIKHWQQGKEWSMPALNDINAYYEAIASKENPLLTPQEKVMFAQAQRSYQANNNVEGIRLMQQFVEKYPNSTLVGDAYFYIAEIYYYKLEKKAEAKAYLDKALKQDYFLWIYWANFRLATIYKDEQEWQKAQHYYQKALQYHSHLQEQIEAELGIMQCLFYQNKQDSTRLFLDALAIKSLRPKQKRVVQLYKAKLAIAQQQWNNAMQAINSIIMQASTNNEAQSKASIDDTLIEAYYWEAFLYAQNEQLPQAIQKSETNYSTYAKSSYWKQRFLQLLSHLYEQAQEQFLKELMLKKVKELATE